MNYIRILGWVGTVICLLAACGPSIRKTPQVTETVPADTQESTPLPLQVTETLPAETQEPNPYPLSEYGPYHVGVRIYTFTDTARNGREVAISIYYPAVPPDGSTGIGFFRDASLDPRDAPYPLILSSTKVANIFAHYLVSYGFIWVGIQKIDTYRSTNPEMLHQPLDILFALEQVASNPPQGFEGMIDAEHAGATGYSFDGFNTLMLSGTRIDPQLYLELCADPEQTKQSVTYWFEGWYNCGLAGQWDSFSADAGKELTSSQDGLWQPVTDERIRAVMPMAADGFYLFGEKGLAFEDRPALMIAGSVDELYAENALIFEHLGTPDKALITFIGKGHMMIYDSKMVTRMAHFMVAFFGYHLQGREEFARYFSEDFVSQFDDLAWGVYKE